MSYAGNTPSDFTVLRLEARKSFSFTIRLKDGSGQFPLDITGCSFAFVMKTTPLAPTIDSDTDNLVVNAQAEITDAEEGAARFYLQASDLSAPPKEYPFAIVMLTAEGYSAVVVKGVVELLKNTEYASVFETYEAVQPEQGMEIRMEELVTVEVRIGGMLPPGMNYMSDQEKEDLAELVENFLGVTFGTAAYKNIGFFALHEAGVPVGGLTNRYLAKKSNNDYDMVWQRLPKVEGTNVDVVDHTDWTTLIIGGSTSVDDGAGQLDATNIPDQFVPTSFGNDQWDWAPVLHPDADGLSDGTLNVIMTALERSKLSGIAAGAQVNVVPTWAALTGKPTFGTAALANTDDFAPTTHTHKFLDLTDVEIGNSEPLNPATPGALYLRLLD